MKSGSVNQEIKKNFILYKGHTGWKVKTRIFGSLLVTFSTLALLGTVSEINGQAATGTNDATPAQSAATQPADNTTQSDNQSTVPVSEATQAPVEKAASAPINDSESGQSQPANSVANDKQVSRAVPETESVSTNSGSQADYPVLSPNSSVNVGADTTQVSLSANQIADHFTATVENRGSDDQDDDVTDNTTNQKIGTDGTINLTTNESHPYYSSTGQSTTVTGHQVAHVSFEHEIDFSHNFSMSGALGIGSKSSGGADSVGFVFAPGDPSEATKGGSGGQLGIGGLANAFGFIFDEYYNADYHDPSSSPYIGWRTTDANGKLQYAASSDWQLASQAGLNDRSVNTLNNFRMDYDATTQTLTVVLGKVALTRKISDVSSGYSLSVSASTGGSWNDYAARIDQFSYTPKTIPLTIDLVDSADGNALLDKTNATAVANIGDTISVFSTQAAANRAVALGEVDPSLVSVLPKDSAGNVYVIDGNASIANNAGVVHYIGGTQNKALADATYYTYTVADGDGQQMTVPVRLAFTAVVTPVDSQTQQPIPGLEPVTVVTVAGEPTLVQIPGYTPTQVVLAAPTDGQTVAHDNLLVDQTTANPDGTTPTTTTSDAIAHYYTATGTTVDGQTVITTGTVGTGQSIADNLNQQWYDDATGKPVASGGKAVIDNADYTWSEIGSAGATDSTDASQPQQTGSILVPTTATLQYWDQQAIDNQTKADQYKAEAQTMFNQFIALGGLTTEQKATAQAALDAITKIYTDVSDSNGVAKTAFEMAEQETDPATIYQAGQTGYASLKQALDLLVTFQADLTQLDTTNQAAQNSLVTLGSWDVTYGDTIGLPTASFGDGFGSLTEAQKAGFNQANYFQFAKAGSKGVAVVPTDVGEYLVNVTDAGRAYLKSLNPDNPNLGLFVSGVLTINPKSVKATIQPVKVTYGETPVVDADLGETADELSPSDFEFIDALTGKAVSSTQLQVKGNYMVQYTAAAQADFKKDGNYQFDSFGTAGVTVTPKAITVTAQDAGKAYGNQADPTLALTSASSAGLVNGDKLTDLAVKLTRVAGENAGEYTIQQDSPSTLNPNYQVTVTPGTFTITKLPVTVKVADANKIYGDADPTFTLNDAAQAVLVKGDSLADLGGVTYTRAVGETVGVEAISGRADGKSLNYDVTVDDGTLTIKQRPVTVTADPLTKQYGNADPVLTYQVTTGTVKAGDDLGITLTRLSGDTVGHYAITELDSGENSNYDITFVGSQLNITPRLVTIKIADAEKTYGNADPIFTYQVTTGTVIADDNLQLELSRETGENARQYVIGAGTTAGNLNYDVTVKTGNFTINARPITVTATAVSKEYDTADPTLTYQVTTGTVEDGDDLGVTLTRDAGENVGNYAIKLSAPATNQNYAVTYKGNNFTINARPVTVTATAVSKEYGTADPSLTYRVTTGMVKAGDDLGVTLVRQMGENAGSYDISMPDSATNKNYNVTFEAGGQFTIGPRAVTVTANAGQKDYGDPDSALTYKVVAGAVENGDDLGVVLIRKPGENAGSYDIYLSDAVTNQNYAITFNGNKFVIKPRPVTVNVAKQTKVYGEADPTLSLSNAAAVLVNGDKDETALKVVLDWDHNQNVGDHQITGTSTATNYAVTVNPGMLTITPAEASLEIGDVTITYGDQPTFNEKFSPALKTRHLSQTDFEVVDSKHEVVALDQLKAGGNYTIRLTDAAKTALLAATPNYQFTTIKLGQLTVAKRQLTVQIANQLQYAGAVTPKNQIRLVAGSLLPDDDLSALQLELTTLGSQNVGTYSISGVAANPNYAVTVLPGQLTVLGREVDAAGNVTITEKDSAGQVVRITKQWTDQTTTIYRNDPSTHQQVVTELVGQKVVSQQTITPVKTRVILPDGTGAATVVEATDPENPSFDHYTVDPDGDGVSSAAELAAGTDPLKADTNGDGMTDGTELRNHTNPLVADAPQKSEKQPQTEILPQATEQAESQVTLQKPTVQPVTPTLTKPQKAKPKQSVTQLPQTGEQTAHGLGLLGLLLMTFLTGLVTRKRD